MNSYVSCWESLPCSWKASELSCVKFFKGQPGTWSVEAVLLLDTMLLHRYFGVQLLFERTRELQMFVWFICCVCSRLHCCCFCTRTDSCCLWWVSSLVVCVWVLIWMVTSVEQKNKPKRPFCFGGEIRIWAKQEEFEQSHYRHEPTLPMNEQGFSNTSVTALELC